MKRPLLALGLALFTLACVPGLNPAATGDPAVATDVATEVATDVATDALATEAILAEPLGAAPDAATGRPAASGGDLASVPPKARPDALTASTAPEGSGEVAPAPGAPPEPEVAPEPKPPASPEEAACLRKGGLWMHAGKSIAMTCVKMTKDAGKQCHREQDCQGQCLARSMTCAPYDPLFGCNEVLQNDGARVTLCID